jgi:hypothetical protein
MVAHRRPALLFISKDLGRPQWQLSPVHDDRSEHMQKPRSLSGGSRCRIGSGCALCLLIAALNSVTVIAGMLSALAKLPVERSSGAFPVRGRGAQEGSMKTKVSRRHVLASAAVAMMPAAAPSANSSARRNFAFPPCGTAELPSYFPAQNSQV